LSRTLQSLVNDVLPSTPCGEHFQNVIRCSLFYTAYRTLSMGLAQFMATNHYCKFRGFSMFAMNLQEGY